MGLHRRKIDASGASGQGQRTTVLSERLASLRLAEEAREVQG